MVRKRNTNDGRPSWRKAAIAGGIVAAILFGYLFALLAKPKTKM